MYQPRNTGPDPVNPAWLAGTADRHRTVNVLRAGFAEGRLTQDEYDERAGLALAARTYQELAELVTDLPAGPMVPMVTMPPAGPGFVPCNAVPHTPVPHNRPRQRDAFLSAPLGGAVALVLTALVIFMLAALVTAVITYNQQPIPLPPFGHVYLLPQVIQGTPGS